MADVNTAEYFMADMYVRVVIVMASAGTLLTKQTSPNKAFVPNKLWYQTKLLYNVLI